VTDSTQALATWLKQSPLERSDAECIACFALQVTRSYLYSHSEHLLTDAELTQCNSLQQRRLAGEPMAYITGQTEFWSLPLVVTQDVLIPRDDTGCLVEHALKLFPTLPTTGAVLDAGTGSGAVAIAFAPETQSIVFATDCSAAALQVATINAKTLVPGQVHFLQGHWLHSIAPQSLKMLLSNPPYIAAGDPHLQAPELQCDPQQALVSGADGLDAIRELVSAATRVLIPHGVVVIEHGYDQGAAVRALLFDAGLINAITVQDLSGNDRVTHARQG